MTGYMIVNILTTFGASGFVCTAEHVYNLVLVKFLQLFTRRAQIVAGIKFTGLLNEYLADGSCHGQTSVAVDIDLADS